MILIIKKIGATTSIHHIEAFLAPALKGGLFGKKGILESLEIKMFKHPELAIHEYHAIVRVEPDAVGHRIIHRLNRKICDGKPVNVCQYHVRYRTNDRRDAMRSVRQDRRVLDRRRKNLEIIDVTKARNGSGAGLNIMDDALQLAANPFDNRFKI